MASAIGRIVQLDMALADGVADSIKGHYEILFAINEDGLRIKVDGGVWSPPLGIIWGSSQ